MLEPRKTSYKKTLAKAWSLNLNQRKKIEKPILQRSPSQHMRRFISFPTNPVENTYTESLY